jgi:hypothetical protein
LATVFYCLSIGKLSSSFGKTMTILSPSNRNVKKLSALISLGLLFGLPMMASNPAFSRPDRSMDYYDESDRDYRYSRQEKADSKHYPVYGNSDNNNDRYDYSKYRRRTSKNVLEMPRNVERKLLKAIASNDDLDRLQVISSQPRTFNGCLGIYKPDIACTEIAIQGWQAIVSNGKNTWVYHLDRDGSKIAKNTTASGAKQSIDVSFQNSAELASNAIFRSIVSGGLTANKGTVTTYTLTRDGKIIQSVTGPLVRSMPVVLKTLSPQEVRQFEQLLSQQRFPNLNGFNYTNKSVTDLPTTSLESMGARVNYIDPDLKSLPNSLRRVSAVWNRLLDKSM